MWPAGKSFFSRSSSSTKSTGKSKGEKELGTGRIKISPSTTPSPPPVRPVEQPFRAEGGLACVPRYLRGSSGFEREREREGDGEIESWTHGHLSMGLGYGVLRRNWRCEGASSAPSPRPSPLSTTGQRSKGTSSASRPRTMMMMMMNETPTLDDESSGALLGDASADDKSTDFDFESDANMNLKKARHPPRVSELETRNGKPGPTSEVIATGRQSEILLHIFNSQPTHLKAKIEQIIGTQEQDYFTRYQEFPHADRTADILYLNHLNPSSITTTTTATENGSYHSLTPSQYNDAQRLLQRKKSDWALRKQMLLNSPNHKLYLEDVRRKHADPSEKNNALEFFVVQFLGKGKGEVVEWSPEIVRKRGELVEHGVRCREGREEDGRAALYSVSGPAVRRRKLEEAEGRLGGSRVKEGGDKVLFEKTSLRKELRSRRGRSEDMAVMVGGTSTTRDYSTLDDIGLGNLSASQLAGFGLESPLSEASDKDDAHVDALRFALGGLSHLPASCTSSSRTSPSKTTKTPRNGNAPTTPSRNPRRRTRSLESFSTACEHQEPPHYVYQQSITQNDDAPDLPPKSPRRRQTKTWEPIPTNGFHHQSLNRELQDSEIDSKNKQRSSSTSASSSSSESEMKDASERMSGDDELAEAKRIVDEAKAKARKRAKRRALEVLEREAERNRVKDEMNVDEACLGSVFL
ncbi:hypothetical protein FKW77_009011 [Venturia effusa]|uniref:Uncharacterized protein n=1 Tax=Venturia effusa TaxID=50376 RepID=A0A517L7Y5_9PEZI|nr:hypothetical protein FKW77_009011 [Venturia effusa]